MNDDASHYSSGYNSVGQASYAVAMANDAIDNARRAAAESRNRRSHSSNANDDAMQPRHPQPQQQPQQQPQRQPPPKPLPSETPQTPRRDPIPGTAEFVRNDRAESMAAKITRNLSQRHHQQQQQQQHQQQPQQKQSQQKQPQPQTSPLLPAGTEDLDLKTNDNAFHVIGTLLTDRLLPKLDAHPGCTHYSLDQDDVDFFNGMLPYSVRRRFVDAVRYRLQLIKSGGRMGSAGGDLGEAGLRRLTMQCQLLGLERMHQNVLLDLAQSVGKSYPINLKDQGPLAFGSAANDTQHQYQQRNVSFGLVPSAAGASPTSHGGIHDTFSSGTAGAGIWNAADNDGDATDPTLQALAMIDGSTSYEATAESLARQQIMAEIHETKLLMKGSVTPEATQFWKKHLEELSQRLVILSLEEQMSKVGQDGDAGRGRDDSGPDGDWDGGVDRSTRNRGANNDVMYTKVKQHYGPPNVPSQMEYLENNRRMREKSRSMGDGPQYGDAANHYGNNYNDGSYQPPVHHVVDAQVVYPSDGTVQSNAHGSIHNVQSHHTSGNNHVGNNFHNESSTVPSEPLKSSLRLGGKRELEELPVCDVVAPSDLPGGYMFEAQLGTKKFLATVPQGGVTKGQRFVSTMRELEIIEIPVPLGAWRDEAHECCNDGVLHPLFLNTLFFPCIALGQIMTRNGLDWQGDPANKLVSSTSCANMTVILTFWLAMNFSAFFMLRVQWERGYLVGAEHYVPIVLFNIFVLIYLINLTRVVRESIRNKYQIPEERCLGCEDCVCATFCMPCAICQMGRHTADFDTYRGTCCTKTGLPRQVELAPVTFYEDQYENADQTHIV